MTTNNLNLEDQLQRSILVRQSAAWRVYQLGKIGPLQLMIFHIREYIEASRTVRYSSLIFQLVDHNQISPQNLF
jgi:hypothetical protein